MEKAIEFFYGCIYQIYILMFMKIPGKVKSKRRKGESLFSTVTTGMVCGIHSFLVQVEVDTAQGLPCFQMVGYLGSEVKDVTIGLIQEKT